MQSERKTGLDVNDTEDNFKLNFIMIAKECWKREEATLTITPHS